MVLRSLISKKTVIFKNVTKYRYLNAMHRELELNFEKYDIVVHFTILVK